MTTEGEAWGWTAREGWGVDYWQLNASTQRRDPSHLWSHFTSKTSLRIVPAFPCVRMQRGSGIGKQ